MKRSKTKTSIRRDSRRASPPRRQRLAVPLGLDHLAQPHALLVRGEVLELVGDRAAVGLAHPRQRLEQGLARARRMRRIEAGIWAISSGVRLRFSGSSAGSPFGSRAERVEVRREVAVGAVGLEQRGRRLDRLHQLEVGLRLDPGRGRGRRRRRRPPAAAPRRRPGCAVVTTLGLISSACGDLLVEVVLAREQLVDAAQERPRLGALDHAVVVGRGHRHHLGDAERLDLLGGRVLPLDRVGDRAGGDDRALADHQPRHRGDGAQPARVGERDVGALEVVRGELVLPRLVDQVLVVAVEAGEVERVGAP